MRLLLLPLLALLPSCAYMQTHKNVEEQARLYPGYQFPKPRELYRSGKLWYVAAHPAQFRKSYDFVHDNVFRKSAEPSMQLAQEPSPSVVYHALSPYTATVLLRPDGYADQATLARELQEDSTPWLDSLPHARAHQVLAQVDGEPAIALTQDPVPAEIPFGYRVLSGLDFLFVDVPGTLVYNVAVPFVAPFVFFNEFLED